MSLMSVMPRRMRTKTFLARQPEGTGKHRELPARHLPGQGDTGRGDGMELPVRPGGGGLQGLALHQGGTGHVPEGPDLHAQHAARVGTLLLVPGREWQRTFPQCHERMAEQETLGQCHA